MFERGGMRVNLTNMRCFALSGVRRSNCEKCRNCHFTHQAAADGREFTALSDSSGYSGDSVTVKYVET